MTLETYILCFVVAILGAALQIGFKIKSIQDKARKANVEFSAKSYFKDDWITFVLSGITIVICIICVDEFAHFSEAVMQYVKFAFAFIGYTGSDILSRLFSVANRKINNAIDYKTTQADEANGTTNKPTPVQ